MTDRILGRRIRGEALSAAGSETPSAAARFAASVLTAPPQHIAN